MVPDSSHSNNKITRLVDSRLLTCMKCNTPLHLESEILLCGNCGYHTALSGSKYIVSEYDYCESSDSLDKLKYYLKGYPRFYEFIKRTISPLYFDNSLKEFIKSNEIDLSDELIVNLGSGNSFVNNDAVNIDIINYPLVDIVSGIGDVPLADNCVDKVVINSVLEHVEDPIKVIDEIYRVLKPGGQVYSSTPFIVGFHASPSDYYRWTVSGVRLLFGKYNILDIRQEGGATSAMLWVFQEWLALLLSFGNQRIHNVIYIAIMLFTWPIKYLDILLPRDGMSNNISSCFICIAEKPLHTE